MWTRGHWLGGVIFEQMQAVSDDAVGAYGGDLVGVMPQLHHAEPSIQCFIEFDWIEDKLHCVARKLLASD